MPEIIADNISIINSDELEGTTRIDAEYYQPKYLRMVATIFNKTQAQIQDIATLEKRRFHSSSDGEFDYIEISEISLSDGSYNPVRMSNKNAPSRAQRKLEINDVIISTVRPIRNAVSSINKIGNVPLVCSSGFAVLKSSKLQPECLFVWLKTRYTYELLDRLTTATMYPAVSDKDILKFHIPIPPIEIQQEIKNLILKSKQLQEQSKFLYSQAEALLLESLDIKDIDLSHEPCYEVNSADAINSNRIDAEYYQPKYERVIEAIKKQDHKEFWEIAFIDKTANPPYSIQREIPIITQKHLGQYQIDEEFLSDPETEYTTLQFTKQYSKYVLQKEDILLYSVGAYIGKANIFNFDIKAVSGSFLTIIRTDKDIINPYYLLAVLNSLIGVNQSKRHSKATAQQYLYPTDIRKFIIPILNKTIQKEIGQLIIDANSARCQAKGLLEEAKCKVEEMIEKG